MKKISNYFGKIVLREVEKQDIINNIQSLSAEFGERPVKRAMHFVNEMNRVDEFKECLESLEGTSGN